MLHPRIKKELRLVAAPAGIIVSLSLILLFLRRIESGEVWNSIFSFFGLGLALSYFVSCQFGSELSLQNLGWGMSMPWSRQQFWREKLKVTLPFYATLSALSIYAIFHFHQREATHLGIENSGTFYILCFVSMAWACMGPGIFLTLKLRNLVASLWLTCLLPFILTFLLFMIVDNTGMADSQFGYLMFMVALVYGGAGWWLARAAFLKWEDKGMHATEMDWNLFGLFNRSNDPASYRYQPWKAMVFRELRLQQTNLFLGGFLLAIAASSGLLVKWGGMGKWIGEEPARFVSHIPELISFIILFIPASLACVTTAESRRLDVHFGELVGPVRRRDQFLVKCLMTIFLGWLIAGLMPHLILTILHQRFIPLFMDSIPFQIFSIIIGILSLYAGSFCFGYLKSFSLSLLMIPVIMICLGKLSAVGRPNHLLTALHTFIFILPFITWRSYRNSLSLSVSWRTISRNILHMVFAVIVVSLLLRALADRSWERVTLLEPSPEHSILRPGVKPSIFLDFDKGLVLSPDGTVWRFDFHLNRSGRYRDQMDKVEQLPVSHQLGHLVQFAYNYNYRFVLDSRNHLWMWTIQSENQWFANKTSIELIPMMHDRTWKKISAGRLGFLAVASDGTLWSGGQSKPKKPALAELPELAQVDVELPTKWEQSHGPVFDIDMGPVYFPVKETFTDWKDCLVHHEMFFALRENGQLYAWGNSASTFEWNRLTLARTYLRDIYPHKWKVVEITGPERGTILITTEDGNQWISAKNANVPLPASHQNHQPLIRVVCRNGSNVQPINDLVSLSHRSFLSNDGAVWGIAHETYSWDSLPERYQPYAKGTLTYHVKKMGGRSDWVAQLGNYGMTADGKLWNWDQRNRNQISPIPPRFRHKVIADLNP